MNGKDFKSNEESKEKDKLIENLRAKLNDLEKDNHELVHEMENKLNSICEDLVAKSERLEVIHFFLFLLS